MPRHTMPLLTFALPAFLATVLLALHCWRTRGPRFALAFFGFGFAYFVAKENLSAIQYFHVYTFPEPPPLRIGLAPVGIVVGWLFTAYLSWTIAERLVGRFERIEGRLFPIVVVAMVITSTVAYPVEAVGTSLGWWDWTVDGRAWAEVAAEATSRPFVVIPGVPLIGWPMFVGAFLVLLLGLDRWLGERWWLVAPLFALGAACHFQAVHGIGRREPLLIAIELALFAACVAFSRVRSPRPPAPLARTAVAYAPEVAVAAMALVVTGFVLLEIGDPMVLASLVPIVVFVALARPRFRPRVLAAAAAALFLGGLLGGSPVVATLGLFPAVAFALLGVHRVASALRPGAVPRPPASPAA